MVRVVLYGARDCHLCDHAKRALAELRQECEFELEEVDITGDPELETRYRQLLPVVEIDGERVFVYHVPRRAFLRKVGAQSRHGTAS